LGLQLPLHDDTDLVASVRYTGTAHVLSGGAVELKIQDIAPDALTAQTLVDSLTSLLGILRGITVEHPPHTAADVALRSVLESVKITQHDDHAVLTANASLDQLKALAAQHNPAAADVTPQTAPASK